MLFYGQWDVTLDSRNRVCVLSKFRKALGVGVIIIQNGKDVSVYPGKKIRQFSAEQMGQLWLVRIDKKGRILIPKKIVQSSFPESRKITWVGWKDYFKLINGPT